MTVGLALSDLENAEFMADSLEAQLQHVNSSLDPTFTAMFEEAMPAYLYAPANERTLTKPSEVLQAIKGLKVDKAPGPNCMMNRVL
jgi:hypothetical protein